MTPLAIAMAVLGAGMGLYGTLQTVTPIQRAISFYTSSLMPNNLPTPDQLTSMRYKNLIDRERYTKEMKAWGFSEEWTDKIFKDSRTLLSVSDLLDAWRRGLIDETTLENELRNHRFNDESINVLKKLAFMIPSVSDLIRFTVREVFNPTIAERFGQFLEFPSEADIERARKIFNGEIKVEDLSSEPPTVQLCVWALRCGIDPDVLKMYWASHWELPSLTAGYEMLHRLRPELVDFKAEDYRKMGLDPENLKFTLDDLKLLLKAQDVMPFWRDRLTAISYALPTRVDLRRMLHDGIISDEEAHKYYMMLGYTSEDAWKLVKLAKTMYKDENKELTRSLILKAYIMHDITRDQAKRMLIDLGYSEGDAEFILHVQDIENQQEIIDENVDVLIRQFIYGVIDETKLSAELDRLGLTASRRDYIINLARLEKAKRIRLPSKTDVFRWYQKGLISENTLRMFLERLGYDDVTIRLYLRELKEGKGGET